MRNAAVAAMAGRVAAVAAMRNQVPTAKSSTYVDFFGKINLSDVKTRKEPHAQLKTPEGLELSVH